MDINDFDPDGVGVNNGNYFGMIFTEDDALLSLISIPWDVTASFGGGASFGPDAMIEVSTQMDFYDPVSPGAWRKGIATVGVDYSIQDRSARLRADARKVIDSLEHGSMMFEEFMMSRRVERINNASQDLNAQVYNESKQRLDNGKIIGLVGGDHSVPLGLIKAVGEKEESFGILHIDAHCDLREAYEGFTYSHASIMYNVLKEVPQVEKIVQVGVRDFSEGERTLAVESPRVEMFDDWSLVNRRFAGETWDAICRDIVATLPQKVYVSFDIDALTMGYCPSTGTPVAGGLTFNEAVYLVDMIAVTGRTVVGFDLCEVAPGREGKWDAIVGARLLFKLCGITLKSQEKR